MKMTKRLIAALVVLAAAAISAYTGKEICVENPLPCKELTNFIILMIGS